MVEILRFKDYDFQYNNSSKLSLKKINLTIDQGDFVIMIGETGSGKSTLLKQLLPELTTGKVVAGELKTSLELNPSNFAYVSQFVDNQMIMETARDELTFVLDNQGCSNNEIQLRITEIASYLGIVNLLDKKSDHLSGGQKQLINLASALILKPKVLLLDEPTSQLDPIASDKLLQIVHKINEEFNMTIILVEHEIKREISDANRLVVMEQGKIIIDQTIGTGLKDIFQTTKYKNYLTQLDRLFLELNLDSTTELPLTNRQLMNIVQMHQGQLEYQPLPIISESKEKIFTAKNLKFRFGFNDNEIINNVDLSLSRGNSYCVVGPNGMGKTTLLKILTRQLTPQSGTIKYLNQKLTNRFFEDVFVLPQDPASLFIKETVEEELLDQLKNQNDLNSILQKFDLIGLEDKSPYDLSGGQQEFLALALGFIKKPQILFLDEPTKGLDPNKRLKLGKMLGDFQKNGGTVLANSHDLLFAAQYFDRIAMLFDGKLSQFNAPVDFFSDKFFYTTEINKALRESFPQALSWKDIKKIES